MSETKNNQSKDNQWLVDWIADHVTDDQRQAIFLAALGVTKDPKKAIEVFKQQFPESSVTKSLVTKAAPGPPPRPNLVWKESTHRWINPHTGEEHDHTDKTTENSTEDHASFLIGSLGGLMKNLQDAVDNNEKVYDETVAKRGNSFDPITKETYKEVFEARVGVMRAKQALEAASREKFKELCKMNGAGSFVGSGEIVKTAWTKEERDKRQDVHNFVGDVLSRAVGKIPELYYGRPSIKGDTRAYYTNHDKFHVSHVTRSTGKSTYIHEMGHHLENTIPGAKEKTAAFAKRRFGDEPMVNLRDKFGGYDSYEMGRADDFEKLFDKYEKHVAFYMGKTYGDGDTEIVSVGMELLYKDPVKFATVDPDFFNFMIDLLQPEPSKQ